MIETKLAMGIKLGHFDGYVPIIKFYNDVYCSSELSSIALSPSMLVTLDKQITELQECMLNVNTEGD